MDKTMSDMLMYSPNDDTLPLCRLQLVVETFGYLINEPTIQNSMKVTE